MKYAITICPNCGMPCGVHEYDASAIYQTIATVKFKCPGCLFYFTRHFDRQRLANKLEALQKHYDRIDDNVRTFAEQLTLVDTPADLLVEAVKQGGTTPPSTR